MPCLPMVHLWAWCSAEVIHVLEQHKLRQGRGATGTLLGDTLKGRDTVKACCVACGIREEATQFGLCWMLSGRTGGIAAVQDCESLGNEHDDRSVDSTPLSQALPEGSASPAAGSRATRCLPNLLHPC